MISATRINDTIHALKSIWLFESEIRPSFGWTHRDCVRLSWKVYFWRPENLHSYLECIRALSSISGKCERFEEHETDGTFPKNLFDTNGCSIGNLPCVSLLCLQMLFNLLLIKWSMTLIQYVADCQIHFSVFSNQMSP